jgi:hypothetical protein
MPFKRAEIATDGGDVTEPSLRHSRVVSTYPEEPVILSWEAVDDVELTDRVRALVASRDHALVLVDGRSGAGKSTFAERLARLLGGALVHTDDVAWHLDPIDWADVLVDGIIGPWRRGETVSFRPPGWVSQDRGGAVHVPSRPVLIVEGVGAGRASLASRADLVVWVQSDRHQAHRRGIARDEELGRSAAEAEAFWDEWMRAEEPFLAADRPWTRASLIVNGTPQERCGPTHCRRQVRSVPAGRLAEIALEPHLSEPAALAGLTSALPRWSGHPITKTSEIAGR